MGLAAIAICDHNSTRNVAAVQQAARSEGILVIAGIEVTSEEEVHVLGLFDDGDGLQRMQRLIDDNLSGENNPGLFGEQEVCNERDDVIGREMKLLIGATRLTVEAVVGSIREFGGLAIASHVDRESFSLLGQLGLVPEGLPLDALELSSRRSAEQAGERFPGIGGFPLVRGSDAHRLAEIGAAATALTAARPSVSELRKALAGEGGRRVAI